MNRNRLALNEDGVHGHFWINTSFSYASRPTPPYYVSNPGHRIDNTFPVRLPHSQSQSPNLFPSDHVPWEPVSFHPPPLFIQTLSTIQFPRLRINFGFIVCFPATFWISEDDTKTILVSAGELELESQGRPFTVLVNQQNLPFASFLSFRNIAVSRRN